MQSSLVWDPPSLAVRALQPDVRRLLRSIWGCILSRNSLKPVASILVGSSGPLQACRVTEQALFTCASNELRRRRRCIGSENISETVARCFVNVILLAAICLKQMQSESRRYQIKCESRSDDVLTDRADIVVYSDSVAANSSDALCVVEVKKIPQPRP